MLRGDGVTFASQNVETSGREYYFNLHRLNQFIGISKYYTTWVNLHGIFIQDTVKFTLVCISKKC